MTKLYIQSVKHLNAPSLCHTKLDTPDLNINSIKKVLATYFLHRFEIQILLDDPTSFSAKDTELFSFWENFMNLQENSESYQK